MTDQQNLRRARASRALTSLGSSAALATGLRRVGILYPFLILFIVVSVSSGPFFTRVNLLDILDQQSSTLIIAAAGTLVLVAGHRPVGRRHLRAVRSDSGPPDPVRFADAPSWSASR